MTVPARVSLVTLGVADVEAAAAFYERLGWRRSSASVAGGVAFFHTAGAVVGLYGYADLGRDAGVPVAPPAPYRGNSLSINVESEAAVDAAFAAASGAGATVVAPPARAFWGGYTGYFADPDGNLWEVAHNPGWPLRADGSVDLPD